MGLLQYQHTMVAAKLLISLCVAGLTAGAPQSQQAIVGNVVTALQPSIARAVAEALRGLGGSSTTNTVATSSTGFTSGSRSSGPSSSGSSFSSAGATRAVRASDDIYVNPAYQFEYKVADDAAQTYISQTESRDGDDVTGTYSYVDPNGDLITVNYRAGIDGFSQTTDKQAGAVAMRSRKPDPRVPPAASPTAAAALAGRPAPPLEEEPASSVEAELATPEAALDHLFPDLPQPLPLLESTSLT